MMGQSFPMDINEWIVRPLLSNVNVVALFLIPMITMRLFAEEKRTGTIELLMTSPINDIEIVLGKWLAAVALYSIMLLVSAAAHGHPVPLRPAGLAAARWSAIWGCCCKADACWPSALSFPPAPAIRSSPESLGFAISLLLWVLNWVSEFGSSVTERVIGYLSVQAHFDSFSKGVLDSKDIIFYVSMIILGLFLTARSLESLRWRA